MRRDFEKLFSHLEPFSPPAGLFDRIISAIRREQELRQSRRLAFGFSALLLISLFLAPFSWGLLSAQTAESGLLQFMSVAMRGLDVFVSLWPDFVMAIAESLPIAAVAVFTANMIIAVFTLRLFLCKKRLLVGCLMKI